MLGLIIEGLAHKFHYPMMFLAILAGACILVAVAGLGCGAMCLGRRLWSRRAMPSESGDQPGGAGF